MQNAKSYTFLNDLTDRRDFIIFQDNVLTFTNLLSLIALGYVGLGSISNFTPTLASIMPYHVASSHDVPPHKIGLGKKEKAYVRCLDPCEYTGGGRVLFEITKRDDK